MSKRSSWSQNASESFDNSSALAYSKFARCQLNRLISSSFACRNASTAEPNETFRPTSPIFCPTLLALSNVLLNTTSTFLSKSGSTGVPSLLYRGHSSLTL
ncbi:hypothetical protein MLD38_007358 [Melastoma candidum]|uniref:Uncharacterized protein n=1 Tax=Melastoma candidum TaxID=119954 RepID=A0ACB9RQU7_9MYRT|nr:hypothetical protein MLD38_007358 [Melastoma candidum]